jgi:hypothetical protein
MGRAAHARAHESLDNEPEAMATLDDEIDALLTGRIRPTRRAVEDALTNGYAAALGLEAERVRLARVLRESARSGRRAEIVAASERLERAERELDVLRRRLARLRAHVYDPLVASRAQ